MDKTDQPVAVVSSDQLGLAPKCELVERLRKVAEWRKAVLEQCGSLPKWPCIRTEAADEIERLRAALRKANDQAEHFELQWYLAKEDADRYTFSKTLEGQVVTAETFNNRGAAELDQALDDAMAEDADARNEAGYAA